jgi:hypothetical protein
LNKDLKYFWYWVLSNQLKLTRENFYAYFCSHSELLATPVLPKQEFSKNTREKDGKSRKEVWMLKVLQQKGKKFLSKDKVFINSL